MTAPKVFLVDVGAIFRPAGTIDHSVKGRQLFRRGRPCKMGTEVIGAGEARDGGLLPRLLFRNWHKTLLTHQTVGLEQSDSAGIAYRRNLQLSSKEQVQITSIMEVISRRFTIVLWLTKS